MERFQNYTYDIHSLNLKEMYTFDSEWVTYILLYIFL